MDQNSTFYDPPIGPFMAYISPKTMRANIDTYPPCSLSISSQPLFDFLRASFSSLTLHLPLLFFIRLTLSTSYLPFLALSLSLSLHSSLLIYLSTLSLPSVFSFTCSPPPSFLSFTISLSSLIPYSSFALLHSSPYSSPAFPSLSPSYPP